MAKIIVIPLSTSSAYFLQQNNFDMREEGWTNKLLVLSIVKLLKSKFSVLTVLSKIEGCPVSQSHLVNEPIRTRRKNATSAKRGKARIRQGTIGFVLLLIG